MRHIFSFFCCIFLLSSLSLRAGIPFQEPPAKPNEWGFLPRENECIAVTPPPFVWREQPGAVSYDLEVAADAGFQKRFCAPSCRDNVWYSDKAFPAGKYSWRVRFRNRHGECSQWSRIRSFTVPEGTPVSVMPSMETLLSRIPKAHPRIFVRPEEMPKLRQSPARSAYFAECDKLLAEKIDAAEIKKYPPQMNRSSKKWMKMWWGNRLKVIRILDSAATLGFAHRLGGKPAYGEEAKRLLLACAQWDPSGASSLRYNDEAGIPFLSRFSRTYSYIHDLLTEAEREQCRQVIRIRGEEAYRKIYPRLFYHPYDSHGNRLWHFLGEAGIVFYNEIPEAARWVEAAMNYYFCVYPVWSDDDGGWHEGLSYWREYLERFMWWAEIMQNTFGVSILDKPFFRSTGYFAMYISVPGTSDGGFGDLAYTVQNKHALLMKKLALLTGNSHYNWYAETIKPFQRESLYLEFLRKDKKEPPCKAPTDLPLSRLFRGNGLAVFNTDLTSAENNIRLMFKSSPRGAFSHGYDANNSFLLNVGKQRVLIRSGIRDMNASAFHRGWMWETKSENNITVDGRGQLPQSVNAKGEITGYSDDGRIGFVSGSAAGSYEGRLLRYDRQLLFLRPGAIVVVDTLEAPKEVTYRWLLHARKPFSVSGQRNILAVTWNVGCQIDILEPQNLQWSMTDKFDPPIRKDIKLVESHLTFTVPEKSRKMQFITLIRPFKGSRPGQLPFFSFAERNGKKVLELTQKTQRDTVEITTAQGIVSVNQKALGGKK